MLEPDQLKQVTYAIADGIDAGFAKLPTLRDQFAMAALQGLLAQGFITKDVNADWHVECAAEAYAQADAMLAVREPKTQPSGEQVSPEE